MNQPDMSAANTYTLHSFVELGGGVGGVLVWSREEAYVKFGFR